MTKKQLLEKIEVLEYNVRVLTDNNQIQYDNIKKYEKKLERLAEIGKATELAFKDCIFVIERSYEPAFNNVDDLIGYYRKEVE